MDWRREYFKSPPSEIGTKRETDRRCGERLWALDRLIRRWNDAERDPTWVRQRGERAGLAVVDTLKMEITKVWPTYFAALPVTGTPSFAEYEQAKRRIKRIDEDIKPGCEDALMEHLLWETLTHGHFDASGCAG